MKTFDEKDLITWANRDKAEVDKEYYFADGLIGMKSCINNNCSIYTLDYIVEESICMPFYCKNPEGGISYACILPVDAVKEQEKKYRPCKNIRELHNLVNDCKRDISDNVCIDELLCNRIIHYRGKKNRKRILFCDYMYYQI